jgi:hypothetical protein
MWTKQECDRCTPVFVSAQRLLTAPAGPKGWQGKHETASESGIVGYNPNRTVLLPFHRYADTLATMTAN